VTVINEYIYMGRRMNRDNKIRWVFMKVDSGVLSSFNKHWLKAKIGQVYSIPSSVDPTDEKGTVGTYYFGEAEYVRYGAKVTFEDGVIDFVGSSKMIAGWELEDFAAQAAKTQQTQANRDKVNELDILLEPLWEIIATARTRNEKAMLIGSIIEKLRSV
jgi:hypothetical protein